MCSRQRRTTMAAHYCMNEPLSLDYCTSRFTTVFIVSLCLLVSTSQQLPTRTDQHRSTSDSESLSNILKDLEEAMFRLKDYALRVDYEHRKALSSSENYLDVPSAEMNEQGERRIMYEDTYPELVAEDYVKKSTEDTSNRTSLVSQQQQQAAVVGPPAAAAAAVASTAVSSSESQSATTSTSTKTSSGSLPVDDISLREALEFLVNLAKEKKQEKRDHDIPFPVQSTQ